MKPSSILRRSLQKAQQGFAIISALFIIIVLAALGGFILSVSTNQQIGSALDVQGARAYEAARSGIEWGLYQVNSSYNFGYNAPPADNPNTRVCPTSPTSFTPVAPTLASFTVSVTCLATAGTNGAPTSYRVQSTACNQPSGGNCPNTTNPGSNYIERRLDVTF